MPTLIQLKRSTVAAAVPLTTDLDVGEIAINTADSKLFHKNSANAIIELGMSPAERSKLAGVGAGSNVISVAGKSGVVSLVAGDVGLGNVDNTSDANKPVSTAQQTALNLKANLASPALTGTPTAPTATAGTNTTQLATTAFVTTAVSTKANLASPTFTGTPAAPTATAGTNTTQLATTAFVQTAVAAGPTTLDGGTY